ncbi:hypothetical protein DFQ28_000847 [Apophysomyces sp. BC1034]|nr:hypothetical protein DFQ30_004423 [Apophysomyces sp. BC1015]KAG0181104.1 hypothetical protein DFQ29_009335 [Apophysomyces sp. BC1021]KAG0191144.1 hypothetical protein DFQ28_000847 [Apophysomyces sp. BC1034]
MSVDLIPGELSPFTIAIAVLSGFIVFFGYVSMFLKEKLFLSEAFVAVIVGILAGPLVTNGINPYSWRDSDEITKQLTRCVIAIQVMAVGIELPKHYMKKEWLTMFMLLLPVMIFMWLVSGLFIWCLIPPINYLDALVISACVCPTDPILANSVVKGRFAEKHVPAHIRNALSAESGANDGMGFPFLFLAIFLIGEDSVGKAIGKWIYETCLFQIALSCVIGVIVGWIARKILQWSERHHLIDKPSFLSFAIALALFLMSMTGFSGSDDVLACFAAGNAFSWDDWFRRETEEAHFQEVIDMMLNLAIFVYIGAIIPWSDFGNSALGLSPGRLVGIAILILFFRRLPIVILLKPVMPAMKTYREALFSGWFGPMGVGAVFLSKIAKENLEKIYAGQEPPVAVKVINPVVLFIVLASVLVHGTTIPLFKLGKRIRTRTLSISSISSNQVIRLPKFRRSEDDYRSHTSREFEVSMTELERNTLYNTIQRDRPKEQDSSNGTTVIPGYAVDMQDLQSEPGTVEEDFLPDDVSKTDLPPPNIFAGEQRRGSSSALEGQGIRFVEPVKPRSLSQINLNIEKNESSVTSLKGWGRRTKKEKGEVEVSVNSGGLRHLFRRQKDAEPDKTVKDTPSTTSDKKEEPEETLTLEHIDLPEENQQHTRIEVWEEENQIIVEDTQDTYPQYVIDKSLPNWEQEVTEKIKELEYAIEKGTSSSQA